MSVILDQSCHSVNGGNNPASKKHFRSPASRPCVLTRPLPPRKEKVDRSKDSATPLVGVTLYYFQALKSARVPGNAQLVIDAWNSVGSIHKVDSNFPNHMDYLKDLYFKWTCHN